MISKIISKNLFNVNVLRPTTPYNLDVDYNNISYNLKNYLKSRLNYYEDTSSKNLIIESEFSEYWFKIASDGIRINGNKGMDIITKNKMAIDLSCLSINGEFTNVKSIISYYDIDSNSKFTKLKLYKKIDNFCKAYDINNLYYCVLISDNKNVYLSTFKFNKDNINNIIFTKKSNNLINVENFIDPKYGHVRLNLRQRRLELRLNKDVIHKFNSIKLF